MNHDITIDGVRALLSGLPSLRWFSSPSHEIPATDWDGLGAARRVPFKRKPGGILRTWHRFPSVWWL
jgi:hypothetical protein